MQAYEAYLQACPGLAVGQPFDQGLLEGCFNTFSGGFRVVSHVSWLAIWFEWFEAVEPYRISSLVFIGKVENSPVQMAFGILVFDEIVGVDRTHKAVSGNASLEIGFDDFLDQGVNQWVAQSSQFAAPRSHG